MEQIDHECSKNSIKAPIVKKKKKYHKVLTQIVYDFAENTTLNGLKYMADGPSYIEKLFWFVTFLFSAVLCFFMVYKTYVKWETNAVIITLKERLVSAQETPFPAVTICPQAKIKNEYYHFSLAYGTYQIDNTPAIQRLEDIKFHSALVFCHQSISTESSVVLLNSTTFLKTFRMMAHKRSDVFESCEWRGKSCKDHFREVLTADGLCYTFNTLSANEIYRETSAPHNLSKYYLNAILRQKNWSVDSNTYSSSDYNVYPRRGRVNGLREDMLIILKENKDVDLNCNKHSRPGYKVYLHHPADLPQASLHYYAAHPERTLSLGVKLNILTTSDEVSRYDPDVRQCYLPSERPLNFFKTYTQKNCQLECFSTFTYNLCGCVDFYMPRELNTQICSAISVSCVKRALDLYILNETFISNCKCLPSCYDIQYEADVITSQFDQEEYKEMLRYFETYSLKNKTMSDDEDSEHSVDLEDVTKKAEIRIYYRQPQFVAMERSELFGLSQFLADCGGTLGLFLGFSFLTLAEIFYFFTIKLWCNLRREHLAEKDETSNDLVGKYNHMDIQNT